MGDRSVSVVLAQETYDILEKLCLADHEIEVKRGRPTRRSIEKPLKGLGSKHARAAFAEYLPGALKDKLAELERLQQEDLARTEAVIDDLK